MKLSFDVVVVVLLSCAGAVRNGERAQNGSRNWDASTFYVFPERGPHPDSGRNALVLVTCRDRRT